MAGIFTPRNLLHRIANHSEFLRFARFAFVGASLLVLDLAIIELLVAWVGIGVLPAYVVSSVTCVLASFFLNAIWTFEYKEKGKIRLLHLFVAVYLLAIIVNTTFAYILFRWIHVPYLFSRFISSICTSILNYFLCQKIVFLPVRRTPETVD